MTSNTRSVRRVAYVRRVNFLTAVMIALAVRASSSRAQPSAALQTSRADPLTLAQVLRVALKNHPLIEAADARVQAALGSRATARTFANPVLTYQVENVGFPGVTALPGLERETSAFATFPLETLWQWRPRARRAEEILRAAEAERLLARRVVTLDVARAFYRVALAQVATRAAVEVQQSLDTLVRYSRSRVAEGATAEGDLIRLEVERDRAATELAFQQVELVRAQAQLAPYLRNSDSMFAVTLASRELSLDDGVVVTSAVPLGALSEFSSHALNSRPDIAALRARVSAASSETGYQKTLLVRQLGLSIGAKTVTGTRSILAGLSVPFPLFDQNRGEIHRASGERRAAERELAWQERLATAEVEGAYAAAEILSKQVAALGGQFLQKAEESRRVAVAAYREGAAPLLQVIDATRTLSEARIVYYRVLFARQESLLDLYTAAGIDPLGTNLIRSWHGMQPTGAASPLQGK